MFLITSQYGSVKGEEKTFNPYPLTFSPNLFLVQNAYPNRIASPAD